ncbi:MAG: hypothetical protein IKN74_05565 [Clostridia bacterium]|nr:hypothetical protein [Clostridia bacterium]
MNILYGVEYAGFDWLISGLTKLLVIMAILQLIKKLPDLINTIFGTAIKDRGGIKGRLGEMAGIGGMAQKAWTSLGTGAKNLAKLGATAPAALGFAGADKLYKKKHDGKSLMDTKPFRQAKGILAGTKQAWKTGSPIGAYKAYDEGTKAPAYTTSQRLAAKEALTKRLVNGGMDVDGKPLFDSNGNFLNQWTDAQGNVHYVDPSQIANQQTRLLNEMRSRGDAGKHKADEMEAEFYKSQFDGVRAKNQAAIDSLQNYRNMHTGSQFDADRAMAGRIQTKIEKGQKFSDEERAWLTNQSEILKDADVAKAVENYNKMNSEALDLRQRMVAAGLGDNYDGSTSQLALKTAMGVQDGIIETAKNKYAQSSTTISDVDKDALDTISASYKSTFGANVGAYQNNAEVAGAIDSFGGGGVKWNSATSSYTSAGQLKNDEKQLLDQIRQGNIVTSAEDYYGSDIGRDYVEEFDLFKGEAKDDAKTHVNDPSIATAIKTAARNYAISTGVLPADAIPGNPAYDQAYANAYKEEYTKEYYRSLHQKIEDTYGTGGTKAGDAKAARVLAGVQKIRNSGFFS